MLNKSTNNGIGLSLLRNRIAFAGNALATSTPTTVENTIMQSAQAFGARVWSTPWTPAAGFKSTNDVYDANKATGGGINGGSFLGSGNNATNLAYARQLANYVKSEKNSGINLYAISIQNEPDANVTSYEACQWSGSQIHDFTTNLYNALLSQNLTSTMIMLPESENWSDPHGLATAAMNDPNVAADVGIMADHNYDGLNGPGTLTKNSFGKALWETEVAILSGSDSSITNGVYYAQRIHQFMTVAQANVYHYWWLMATSTGAGNEGLMDNNGSITKRLFAFGQFSRFVRPGYYRINASNAGSTALISAYQNTTNGGFAIVAINTNTTTAINQTFALTNFPNVSVVTPWMTTSNLSLANQTPVAVVNSSFTYTLPPLSIVTFVGNALAVVVTSSANPSTYGNAITLTATLKTNGVAVGDISGENITFYDGAMPLGTGTLNSSGQVAYTNTAIPFPAVTHFITAVYAGDATYSNITSAVFPQTVSPVMLIPGLTGTVGKNYDGTTTASLTAGNYILSSALGGDIVVLNNPATGNYDTRNKGTGKTVTVTNLTISGTTATNYALSKTSISAAIGFINQTNLTMIAAANTKNYDGTASAIAVPIITSGGVQSGDTPVLAETYDTQNVGINKTLTPSGFVNDGNGGNNYIYSFVPISTGTIIASPLTVTNLLALDKVYDGTTNAALDATHAGLNSVLNGDNVTLITNNAAGYFADQNAGTDKPVTVAGLALGGNAATNYLLLQPTNLTANILSLMTPIFSSPAISGGAGGWQLNFSAQAGQDYRVLAAGDLALPLNQWTVLTNAMFDSSGSATFTDTSATNLSQRFYQIRSP